MNLTDNLLSEYKPQLALMVYKSSAYDRDGKYYIESHDVNEQGQIMAGKPLLQESIQDMVDLFFDQRQKQNMIGGMITDHTLSIKVISSRNTRLVWYRPEEERVLHHDKVLKVKTDKAWVPAMVYVANADGLDVFALKSSKRPDVNTQLFQPPFFNTDDDGDVCLGSAKARKPKGLTYENIQKYWEDMFWLSTFTHVNGEEKVKSGDLAKLWRSLVGTGKKFPVKELTPLNKTLGSIL